MIKINVINATSGKNVINTKISVIEMCSLKSSKNQTISSGKSVNTIKLSSLKKCVLKPETLTSRVGHDMWHIKLKQ